MENERNSILDQVSDAFASNCASVMRLRQIFNGCSPDELDAFAHICPDDLRDALARFGFDFPIPDVPDAELSPVVAQVQADPAAAAMDVSPEVSALARLLAFFGIG